MAENEFERLASYHKEIGNDMTSAALSNAKDYIHDLIESQPVALAEMALKSSERLNAMQGQIFDLMLDGMAKDIPKGFAIEISIENGSGNVTLFDAMGEEIDMHEDESGMWDQIRRAMTRAISANN